MSSRDVQAEPVQAPRALTYGPAESESGGILTIDLGAIVANYEDLAARVSPVECAAVVKADAYGCGIEPVTTALYKQAQCKTFFVAQLSEARRVRRLAPEALIYVLNGFSIAAAPVFAEIGARPVIGSLLELAEWDQFVATSNWTGGFAIHVDTGMNRLGLSVEEIAAVAGRMQRENHGITLLMSHLACAEQPEHPLNDKQVRLFREIRMLFRGAPASLANSSGIMLGAAAHGDLVRPGAALYGINPTPGQPNPMRPVVELQARVLQIRNVPKGGTVGYGASWTAARPCRIAIISAGYGDGFSRAHSSVTGKTGGAVVAAGRRCPVVGHVSMDLTAIDIMRLPDGAVRRGEMVTLIGEGITVDEVGALAGTIGYEVLTSLGRRHHRVYKL
jgi:alanine racemase